MHCDLNVILNKWLHFIFSSVGRVDDAIKEFMLLKSIDSTILCSFAKAFYKTKQYGQALKCKKCFIFHLFCSIKKC